MRSSPSASRHHADVFAAIGEPTRRRLLDLLGAGEQPVHRLAEPFSVSRPAISLHLRVLRRAGLVQARRAGRRRLYRLRPEPLREVFDWVRHYERFWTHKLKALGEYLDRTAAPVSRKRKKLSRRKEEMGETQSAI